MTWILSDVLTLRQYLSFLSEQSMASFYASVRCCCGSLKLWRHGSYPRKADRLGVDGESLNPIFIQRFYCPCCKKTLSVLPEGIPPHRWHLWATQQAALLLLLAGKSVYAAAKEVAPSRHTIARWLARLREQFLLHKDTLCNHIAALGRTVDFTGFWDSCLKEMPLSKAMRLCHVAGVPVP